MLQVMGLNYQQQVVIQADLKLTPKGSGKLNLDGIKFPNADGSRDQILKTDGSGNLSFADASSGGLSWNGTLKT